MPLFLIRNSAVCSDSKRFKTASESERASLATWDSPNTFLPNGPALNRTARLRDPLMRSACGPLSDNGEVGINAWARRARNGQRKVKPATLVL
jgi:hypothetical protein